MDPRLYRRVYAQLSQRIADGTLATGARLHIGQLADEFDVSRETIQHAIGLLAEEGKVQRWPGLGWYIAEGGGGQTGTGPPPELPCQGRRGISGAGIVPLLTAPQPRYAPYGQSIAHAAR